MPYKSKRPCGQPGCRNLVEAGEGYCPKHKPVRNVDTSHYDRRWQKIRAWYLRRRPLCADCQIAGRLTPATEVHHIIPVRDGGSDAEENLLGLCKSCHSRRTGKGE